MSLLPQWARKPKHKSAVVATDKGWVVEKTGEILVSVKNLDTKLKEFLKEVSELENVNVVETSVVHSETVSEDPVSSPSEEEKTTEEEDTKDLVNDIEAAETKQEEQPKKRGRKPKNKSLQK